jgi:hypothetical protein
MSKRHQASRRRMYGRRQHELHERTDRHVGVLSWIEESDLPKSGNRILAEPLATAAIGGWVNARGID